MRRVPHPVLLALVALVAVAGGSGLAWAGLNRELTSDALFVLTGMVVFTGVGALIEDRRPGNSIGRASLATGVLLVLCAALRVGAIVADDAPGTLPPAGAIMAVLSSVTFGVALVGGSLMIVARYPDGPLAGRFGQALDGLIVIVTASATAQLLRPGPIEYGYVEAVPNPMGVAELGPLFDAGAAGLLLGYLTGMILGAIALVGRYRIAGAVVRAQLRWFLAAVTVPLGLFVLLFTTSESTNAWVWDAWLLSFLLIPLAIGIGILRYRLFDIDRIISRTLSYAVVSAVLAAVFVAVNLLLGTLVASVTGGSTLAVAASTLVTAALFQPLRSVIQAPLDRRFNRAHLDAQRILATFGERFRDETDLGHIGGAVLATADESLRPARAGLWLRGAGR
jgi:hypothetical protein